MHLLRTPSVIRRMLKQRLESRETKHEIVPDGDNIEVTTFEQEAVQSIHEQGVYLAVENDGSVSTNLTLDLVGDDLSRLLPPSFVHREEVFSDEESSSYFFDEMTHFGKQSATFFSDLAYELMPVDPFDCFVEQVVNSLTTASLRGTGVFADVATELQLSLPSDLNHYHQYVDQSSFDEGSQFSEISTLTANQHIFEVQEDAGVIQTTDEPCSHDFGTVEGILDGERLDTGDDDLINFYDGEPIEIGVPVVLEPVQKSTEPIVDQGASGFRNRTGPEPDEQDRLIQISVAGDEDSTLDLLDCSWGDVTLTLHADKSWAGDIIIVERFELGADSLRIESLLEAETMESLLDNRPVESEGAGGEHSLCFSIAVDNEAECTISFLSMSLDEYMDFLSSTVRDMIVL